MALLEGGGKLPGKTAYYGRRRPMTRRSGFKAHEGTTGGEFERVDVNAFALKRGQTLTATFRIPHHGPDNLLGFGGWFYSDKPVSVSIEGGPTRRTLTQHAPPDWNKFGSIWHAGEPVAEPIRFKFTAAKDCRIALHGPCCGILKHKHLASARPELLPNMYQFAPEAVFVGTAGTVQLAFGGAHVQAASVGLVRKSCNRCGRYLPINIHDERNHLSFSNHCVAANRLPCAHATFSRLRNPDDTTDRITLRHGYQLECRFCKKFEVNAAHNPQRTTAQMKEDAARRRAFELLIANLEGGSPLLKYRQATARELSDDVYSNFAGQCFKCGEPLKGRKWHLDHTRPLALLWPLDGTATALCGPCNSDKHDRPPSEFYTVDQLADLSKITGIPIAELQDPKPNLSVIRKLAGRLEWFCDHFLQSDEMKRQHDGKVPRDLLVKALYKVLSRSPDKIAGQLIERMKQRETKS